MRRARHVSVPRKEKLVDERWFIGWRFLWVAALALSCGPRQQVAYPGRDRLPPMGLYSVTERECQNPFNEPDNCPLMAYVELTRIVLPGDAEQSPVLIFWLAPQETLPMYTEAVWHLRGRFVSEDKYFLHDEGSVRDWLVVDGSELREYDLESFRTDERQEIWLKSRLSLRKVERTPQLDAVLRIQADY